jgi:hypothetical protein
LDFDSVHAASSVHDASHHPRAGEGSPDVQLSASIQGIRARESILARRSRALTPVRGTGRGRRSNLSRVWKLNHELSDDTAAKVRKRRAPKNIKGGAVLGDWDVVPWELKFNEGSACCRDVLLGAVRGPERIEVEQTASRSGRVTDGRPARLLPDPGRLRAATW